MQLVKKGADSTADFSGEDDLMVNSNESLHDVDTPEGELFSKQIATALTTATESLQPELSRAITMREIEGKTPVPNCCAVTENLLRQFCNYEKYSNG